MNETETALAEVFASRAESGSCAHGTFPEVLESEFLRITLQGAMDALVDVTMSPEGFAWEDLGKAAEHALILAAAAGMAAGRSDAAASVLTLADVDWDSLPDTFGQDS